MRVLIFILVVLLLLVFKSCTTTSIPQFTEEMNKIICIQEEI